MQTPYNLPTSEVPETNWSANPKYSQKTNILQKLRGQHPEWLSKERYEDIKHFIMSMLGSPTIKVELVDDQLQTAIDLAKAVFIRYLGRERYAYTMGKARQAEYEFPDDAESVMTVYYRPASLSALGNINQALFSDFYLLATDLAVDIYESPVTYWCYMASREMLEKTYGVWGSWENVDFRRFRIYPIPYKDQIIGVHYMSKEIDFGAGGEDRYNLFKKLALAYSKQMLGRIRSKYSAIPGSNNSLLTLDGNALLTEGMQEEKDITTYILSLVPLRMEIF